MSAPLMPTPPKMLATLRPTALFALLALHAMLALLAILAIGAMLALGACSRSPQQIADGPDPIEALGSPARSSRYDVPFWAREIHRGSELWRRAASFCKGKDPAAFPNCHTVGIAAFWESPPPFPRPRHTLRDLLPPSAATPPAPRPPAKGGRP